MNNSIISALSKETKHKLKKIKEHDFPQEAKDILCDATNSVPYLIQFWRDLRTYGLYEALLYLEKYEEEKHFFTGTAEKVLQACNK